MAQFKTGRLMYNYGYAYLLILYTGLRMGEALALKWEDIDFDTKTLVTNGNMIMVKNREEKQNESAKKYIYIHQDTTKALQRLIDKREVPLNDKAVNALKCLKIQNDSGVDGYVICTKQHKPVLPNVFDRLYKKVLVRSVINICGIHSLRHTFASILFENRVDI